MLFLDASYFDGNTYLPAVSRDAAVGISVFLQSVSQGNLDWFIVQYEPEYMKMLLGKRLYSAFIEGMEAETPLDKWVTLRDEIFQSVVYQDKTFKYSPAAEYVFCKFINRNISQTSSKGQVKARIYEADNSDLTNILPQVWNHMCDKSIEIQKFICESGLYNDDVLKDKIKKDIRANRCPVCVVSYRASFKIWHRFCFGEFKKINDLNI